MIKFHAIVLITCSIIGFTGHYMQFGVARATPWIPATMGLFIIFVNSRFRKRTGFLRYLPMLPVFVFGIVATVMCIRFLPQEFQPLRKKIIFSMMSCSSWLTIAYFVKKILKEKRTKGEPGSV